VCVVGVGVVGVGAGVVGVGLVGVGAAVGGGAGVAPVPAKLTVPTPGTVSTADRAPAEAGLKRSTTVQLWSFSSVLPLHVSATKVKSAAWSPVMPEAPGMS